MYIRRSWYENECNEGSDKTLSSATLTIIFESKRIIPLQIGFHLGIILVGCIYVRNIYMTSVHSSGASLQSRKEDVTLVEETNQARSKVKTSRNAFEMLGSRVTSQHNASWPPF